MKKKLLIVLLAVLTNHLSAQSDVFYTIQANYNAAAVQLDSIVVENESNGKVLKFTNLPAATAYKINLIKGLIVAAPDITTGLQSFIENVNSRFVVSKNYAGTLGLNFTGNTTENVQLAVYNLAGMLEYNQLLTVQPYSNLRVNMPQSAVHLVKLTTAKGTQTFRTFGSRYFTNYSATSTVGIQASVSYNSIAQPQKITVAESEDDTLGLFNFAYGDRLSIMVYKSNLIATPVSKVLNVDENISFDLIAYSDVYSDANLKTAIPTNEGDTLDLSGFTLSFGSKTIKLQRASNSASKVRSISRQKIVKHSDGTMTSDVNVNLEITKKGGNQYFALKNPFGVDMLFGIFELPNLKDFSIWNSVEINAESTALATLLLHPFFVNSSLEVVGLLKNQLKVLSAFTTYKSNIQARLVQEFKTPSTTPIDYDQIEGYTSVIREYLENYVIEDTRMKGFVEPDFYEWNGGKIAEFKIINKGKRTIQIFTNKITTNENGIPIYSEPAFMTERLSTTETELPNLVVLSEPGKLDYWSTVKGTFWGYVNNNMPDYIFKSETGDISVDLGDANRLEVEVWGLGKSEKNLKTFTPEEWIKFGSTVIAGVVNDFITPAIELWSETKKTEKPIESGRFDFRYGKRKDAFVLLANKLATEYLKDNDNVELLIEAVANGDYLKILSSIPPFVAKEIYSDISKPQGQTKYLNDIYNAYKNITGVSKNTDEFRTLFKNAYNSAFRYYNIGSRTIDLLEAGGNLAGSFYYVFADGVHLKSTFKKDYKRIRVEPKNLQLLPGEIKQINVYDGSGDIAVSSSDQKVALVQVLPVTPADPNVLKIIEITGVEKGKAEIVISNQSGKAAVSVLVSNQCFTDLQLATKNITVGLNQYATVKIIGGSSSYSIVNSTPLSATSSIKDNQILIYGRQTGTAQILVKDKLADQTQVLTVKVVYFAGLNPTKGLVAYYPFNGNANDESENGNNGIVNGATLTTDRFGKMNRAYSFDGVDDFIKILNNNKISTLSDNYTISYWVQSKDYSLNPICKSGYSTSNGQFRLQGHSYDKISIINNGNEYSFNWMPNKEWNLFTMSFVNGMCNLYINGVGISIFEVFQNKYTSNYDNNNDLFLGVDPWGGVEFFNGSLDDIRIYNRALSSSEVTELYNSEKPVTDINNGLVAYYPFNGNANDGSGNGNNGTVNGATPTTDRFGNANSAYSFDGNGNQIYGVWKSDLTEFTISLWQKTESYKCSWPCFVNLYQSSNKINGFHFNVATTSENKYYMALHSAAKPDEYLFNSISDVNQWRHLTVTYTNGTAQLFIDGILSSTIQNITKNDLSKMDVFYIGTESSGAQSQTYFNGVLDDIRIYNRALSTEEVSKLHEAEKPTLKSGLVAYYPFNGNAIDESGKGNHGTVNGASLTTGSINGYSFDGVNDNITIPAVLNNQRNGTVSLWFNVNEWQTTAGYNGIYLFSATNSNGDLLNIGSHPEFGNKLLFGLYDLNSTGWKWINSNIEPTKNSWYHVVVEWGENGMKFYINNILSGTNNYDGAISGLLNDIRFGSSFWEKSNINGCIDNIRIYNRQLSSFEITEIYETEKPPFDPKSGLVAYYPFNGNANDESGSGNNGTVNGASLTLDRFGNANKAYSFDGAANNILVNNSSSLQNINEITISAWVNYSGLAADGTIPILDKSNSSVGGQYFFRLYNNGNNSFSGTLNGQHGALSFSGIQTGTWYQLSMVSANNNFTFYLNGQQIGSVSGVGTGFSNTMPLTLGANPSGVLEVLNGKLDDIRIYNRALSSGEIQELYNSEKT